MACACARMTDSIRGPSIAPGEMRLTRTPAGPSSRASVRTNPTSAILLVAYGVRPWNGRLPVAEPMTTTVPDRRRNIDGSSARHRRKVPVTLTRSVSSHSSRVTFHSSAVGPAMPALHTSASRPPTSASIRCASASTSPGSRRSVGATSADPPAAVISAAVVSRRSRDRAARTTLAPSCAKHTAITFPTPWLAPVTSAVRPSSWPLIASLIGLPQRQPAAPGWRVPRPSAEWGYPSGRHCVRHPALGDARPR